MRIAILTTGRFWVCDLARELDALGHEVAFYSLVPPWRTRLFGLPPRCNRWLGPYLAPLYASWRALARTRLAATANHLLAATLDRVAAGVIARCDVLIGMSQSSLRSIAAVRRRFGARTLLERGSRHIVSQRDILERLPRPPTAPPPVAAWAVRRELAEYESADVIVVPARHAERSFVEHGVPAEKIFRNPYGVDLRMFPPTVGPARGAGSTIIMAGTWSLRKGCDVLTDAWRRLPPGSRLLHVGGIADAPLPTDPGFVHHPTVDQRQLTGWYGRAHVLALASREEGLALVQAQALASGLHVAATDYTGAEDLQDSLDDPDAVGIAPADDAAAFAAVLARQLERGAALDGPRDLLGAARHRLTWAAYGTRYDALLRRL
jgi:starch synthase